MMEEKPHPQESSDGLLSGELLPKGTVDENHKIDASLETFAEGPTLKENSGLRAESLERHNAQMADKAYQETSPDGLHSEVSPSERTLDESHTNAACPETFAEGPRTEGYYTFREKRYECNICKKTFARRLTLTNHGRIHTGDKPYSCKVCGQAFTQQSILTNHERTHTGEKPYQCVKCGQAFSQKTALTNHGRIHTGEKPYQCVECGKEFAQKATLNKHIQTHRKE